MAWTGSLGRGRSPHVEGHQWLWGGGAWLAVHMVRLEGRKGVAWGGAIWSEALLGSCWEAKEPAR